ncbi:MAG: hypothetical protein OM95_10365 [Bdellovibrio sp. ArHS]|uniref:hypothetical protein n=1 Tax=Bdellovibrio sp. ArHS TaxID=1569284 RepID=UPI000582BC7D|nr:hypothetical protein [Bdellovibrio sp. ArHS]KHD88164.1 MAG: hypothetical protein OM95_10365 [Bdellovibrio sp. ArHS]
MFFKNTFRILTSVTVALTSAGCSEFLNGKKAEPQVMELSDARFKCLQSLPQQLQKFSVGEAQEQDIRDGADCMTEALLYFNKRTFGSLPNAYTVEEMRKFFGKYFLKENNVSPQFAAELMKIKRALLGGSTTYITKEEIVHIVEIMKVVRDEAVLLAPHIKILLNQKTQNTAEWEQISQATDQLRRALQRLLEKTQVSKSEYSFEDAKKALAGFSEFIRGETPFAPYDQYGEWIPVVEAVKNVLMGERAQFTSQQQWSDSLDTLINLYELALKYHYSLSDLRFEDRSKLRQVSQFMGQALQLLQNSHTMKTTGRIAIKDIDNLILQLTTKFPSTASEKALKKTYRAVLIKVLDPERKADTRDLQGLERKHLATISREFNIWRLHQSFIDSLQFEEKEGGYTQSELFEAYKKFNRTFVIEKGLVDDAFEQQALELAWQDFGEILQKNIPVSFNDEGRLLITRNANQLKQTWKSLTKANLIRALARLLTIGWGENATGRMTSAFISQQGLINWYDDFQEIGRDLKAFDPRSANSGGRSFLEANFFTFSGNGDQAMDQSETYEFVSTLVAAGLSSAQALQNHMALAGCEVKEKDVFGNPYINQGCFRDKLHKHFHYYFNNLPGMVQYVQSLSVADWEQFYRHLAVAAEAPGQKPGLIETANIRTLVTILHYIEGMMVMYDADGSSTLSLDEIYAASPRFMSFFKTVTDTKSETLLKEGFAYLVFRGSIPGAGALAGFQWDKMWGVEDAQRMEIARIFGTLKDQLNKPKK